MNNFESYKKMTQEELLQLKVLLDKANLVLNFIENSEISVWFDDKLDEFVLYGKCSSEGVYRTVSSKSVDM